MRTYNRSTSAVTPRARRSGAAARFVLSLFLALFAMPLVAHGQNLTSEDYKKGLDRATAIYNDGDIASALTAYLEVRGKFSGPEVDYSIARAYHKLHQCQDAQIFYMFVMNSYDLPEDNALFGKAANYYNELINCEAWGEVEVDCTAGGTLYINDDKKGGCLDKPYKLREGTYTFKLEVEGAEPVEEKVRVADGAKTTSKLVTAPLVVEKIVEVPMGGGPVVAAGEPNYLAWGLIGGGAALLTTSAFLNASGYASLLEVQKSADRGDTAGRKTAEDDVALSQLMTGITFGVGLAAAGTGIVLLFLDTGSEAEASSGSDVQLSFGPTPDGGAVLLRSRF